MSSHFLPVVLVAALFLSGCLELGQKLQVEFDGYQRARQLAQSQASQSAQISRASWEQTVGAASLSQEETSALRNMQNARISEWLNSHIVAAIDLNRLRQGSLPEIERFCKELPKGGMLHNHVVGVLAPETVDKILTQQDAAISSSSYFSHPDFSKSQRPTLDAINGKKYSSLTQSEKALVASYYRLGTERVYKFTEFDRVISFLQAIRDAKIIIGDFAKRAFDNNVIYAELSFSTGETAYLNALMAAAEQAQKDHNVVLRYNQAFVRTVSQAGSDALFDGVLQRGKFNQTSYIVGIDLVGDESKRTALDAAQKLYGALLNYNQAVPKRLHATMHAGESGDIRNPRDGMILGAERLGHGVSLAQDLVALEYSSQNHVPIEINLTSNLRLGVIKSVSEHPFIQFLRLGLPVSLSTDDEGIFQTDISKECELAIKQTDITYAELKQMSFNSLQTAFVADSIKTDLLARLQTQFQQFEPKW